MNKENTNMVRVNVTLNKEGDFLMIKDFKKVKDGEKYNIHDNFINIMSSKNSIINVARVNNEDGKHIMTISGASFDIVKGYEDQLYLEMTQDEWGQFCFITKEPAYCIVRTDILFLDVEKVIKGTDYSALILNDEALSQWRPVIDMIFVNNGIELKEITTNDTIEASVQVSVYRVIYQNKISKVIFFPNKENSIIYGENHVCKKVTMRTKDIFTKTDWSKMIEKELEEDRDSMPNCKGVIKESDKYVSLLFYIKDPEESLSGFGSWELFKGYDFNKLNKWAQEAIIRDAFVEMFSCQTIFEWEGTQIVGFDESAYVVANVTRYSSFCQMFDDKSIRINAAGLISCESDAQCNTDNLFVVTIAIVKDEVAVHVM
jgi:hypothetical protein